MSLWVEGRVVKQHAWTDSLFSLFIEADIEPFIAGQFCRIALDIDDKRIPRPYSFVNAPTESLCEFYYNHVPGGLLTDKLIQLKPNDRIWVAKRGAGLFTLKQVKDADTLWLFATGTALGVFLSILKTEEPWQRFKNIVLVHAARLQKELTHQDLIQNLQKSYPNLQYVPFVSQEEGVNVMQGRITHALENGALEEKTGLPLTKEKAATMICGNPHMVKDMVEALQKRGLEISHPKTPAHITIENYWKD